MLLFGQTAGERAKETGAAPRTLSRNANEFERYGMQSLFASRWQAEREKPEKRCHKSFATSLWTCTLNYPPCLGEKLPRCVSFVTAEGQITRVSNILRPLHLIPFDPDAISPGISFLILQNASLQSSVYIARDGRLRPLLSIWRSADLPFTRPSSAG